MSSYWKKKYQSSRLENETSFSRSHLRDLENEIKALQNEKLELEEKTLQFEASKEIVCYKDGKYTKSHTMKISTNYICI